MKTERFNLRVYAIIFKDDRILLADESINGFAFTKFPGGGVEFGEGIKDALIRELKEEGDIDIIKSEHFYTTDYFQLSAFNPMDQIISVYYSVEANINWNEKSSDQSIPGKDHRLKLYFKRFDDLLDSDLTFPIDRKVLEMLK